MRISDLSSDVCSSDLHHRAGGADRAVGGLHPSGRLRGSSAGWRISVELHRPWLCQYGRSAERRRSEEHTSELQSLMRISYAVFCLKKKKQIHTAYSHITTN